MSHQLPSSGPKGARAARSLPVLVTFLVSSGGLRCQTIEDLRREVRDAVGAAR